MSQNLITEEYELSTNYELDTFPFKYRGKDVRLVELSRKNVAKVEAMIRTDSKYRILDLNDEEKSPFWIIELGKHLGEIKDKIPETDFYKVVENVVEKIDKENGTRLTTDCKGEINARKEMEYRIRKCKNDGSLTFLKATDDSKYRIIEELSAPTKNLNGRQHRSFASKFCHYACFYFYEGEDAQDNFSIYDKYVLEALPYYVRYYKEKGKIKDDVIKKEKEINDNYKSFQYVINEIIKASGERISRNGFDHLLWYYFKGDRLKKGKALERRKNGVNDGQRVG